ncbi:hypothetical protein GF318_05765 [Candidatus Micrarchaeota archaeon]|nr:hypothetical protein [Candidatus Micrarchaeota archaeon]
MAIQTCQRCGAQTAKLYECDYCQKKVCENCLKSSKRKKVGKRYICKSCWSDLEKRKAYKSEN